MKKHILLLSSFLLSPDAAEGVLGELAPAGEPQLGGSGGGSVLDEDLTNQDTSFPLLKEGLYDLGIDKLTIEDNKERTGQNVVIKVKTTADSVDVKDKRLNKGFPMTTYISLTETKDYDKEAIKRNLAVFMKAVGHKGKFGNGQWAVGRVARAKVTIRPPKGEYEASNSIKWVPIEETGS